MLAPGLANPAGATPALLASGAVPVPVALLLMVGILSSAISTLDSIALTLGSVVARDLMPRGTAEGRQVLTGRVVVVAVVLAAAFFALRRAGIVDQLAALSAAGLVVTVPATIGAFFWRGGTAAGVLASLAGGAAVAIWLAIGAGVSVFDPRLALGVIGATMLLFVGVSLLTRPRPEALDFAAALGPELARLRVW